MDTKQNEPLFPFAFAPIYQGSFFLKLSQNVDAYFPLPVLAFAQDDVSFIWIGRHDVDLVVVVVPPTSRLQEDERPGVISVQFP